MSAPQLPALLMSAAPKSSLQPEASRNPFRASHPLKNKLVALKGSKPIF
jgi:hypothetical protein